MVKDNNDLNVINSSKRVQEHIQDSVMRTIAECILFEQKNKYQTF